MLTVFFSQPRPRQVMGSMESQAKDTEGTEGQGLETAKVH